jgi:lipocalin-like protein
MKRSILPIVIAASVIGMAGPTSAQDTASQIVGVWKLQKFDRCIVGGECAPTYGEKPTGYIVYTKSGLFMSQGYHTSRVLSKTPDPTDPERIELFKSMFAWGGRYKVDGNKVTVSVELAWIEGWKGQSRTQMATLDGKLLVIESSPFKSPIDGSLIFTKVTLDRVE